MTPATCLTSANPAASAISSTISGTVAPAVPRTVVLAPYLRVLPAGPGAVRIGLDPEDGLIVDRLPEPLVPMLARLERPTSSVEWVAEAVRLGVPLDIAEEVLAGLVAHGVLADSALAELAALRRAQAVVEVRGAGTLAEAVRGGLTEAGIGQVLAGQTRAAPRGRGRPQHDLVVLAGGIAPAPAEVRQLLMAGVDHLVVALREGIGVVGPFTLARRTACPLCVDLARSEADPCWPATAAMIAGAAGSAPPAAVEATAALAVAQVVAAVEGAAPAAVGASLEIDLGRAQVRRRPWSPHPRCTCGAERPGPVDELASARPAGTGRVADSEASRRQFAMQGTIEA